MSRYVLDLNSISLSGAIEKNAGEKSGYISVSFAQVSVPGGLARNGHEMTFL
jgi:hypothetical protein